MTTLLSRAHRETGATPGYASLFHYDGKLIVILGNTVKTREDASDGSPSPKGAKGGMGGPGGPGPGGPDLPTPGGPGYI